MLIFWLIKFYFEIGTIGERNTFKYRLKKANQFSVIIFFMSFSFQVLKYSIFFHVHVCHFTWYVVPVVVHIHNIYLVVTLYIHQTWKLFGWNCLSYDVEIVCHTICLFRILMLLDNFHKPLIRKYISMFIIARICMTHMNT